MSERQNLVVPAHEATDNVYVKDQLQREILVFLVFATVSFIVCVSELTFFIVIYAAPRLQVEANVGAKFEDISSYFIASCVPAVLLELCLAVAIVVGVIRNLRTDLRKCACLSRIPSMISRKKSTCLHIFLLVVFIVGGVGLAFIGLLLTAFLIPSRWDVSCSEPTNQTVTCQDVYSDAIVFVAHPVDSLDKLVRQVIGLFAVIVFGFLKNFLATVYTCAATCCCAESKSRPDESSRDRPPVGEGPPRESVDQELDEMGWVDDRARPKKTVLYLGGLTASVTEDKLRKYATDKAKIPIQILSCFIKQPRDEHKSSYARIAVNTQTSEVFLTPGFWPRPVRCEKWKFVSKSSNAVMNTIQAGSSRQDGDPTQETESSLI